MKRAIMLCLGKVSLQILNVFVLACLSISSVQAQGTGALTPPVAKPPSAPKVAPPAAVPPAPSSKETAKSPPKGSVSDASVTSNNTNKDVSNTSPENSSNKSSWVKLCEKTPLMKKGNDGKETKEEKNICLTHHERLDGNTGMVIVSAAIREVEGQDKKHLMVMVPLGMALPPGLRASVYTKEQWQKVEKNEKIDDKEIKLIELKYALCHAAGCTAEMEADNAIIDQMKVGGGLAILAINAAAQPVGFPIPLEGFTEAFSGKPVDNAEYKKARAQLMAQIRERQQEAIEKFKAEEMKKLPMDAPGAPTVTGSNPQKPKTEVKK